jgi:hypothetical protein
LDEATMTERQNEAMVRLLADAAQGGQAKVDALVALSQRTVWVVPWGGGIEGYRTLINSSGLAALPVFTSIKELEEACQRFGWLDPSGQAPRLEIGARQSFTYARSTSLGFVVVDIASEHSLEITSDELAPLLTNRQESQGPFAASGRVGSDLIAAVGKQRSSQTNLRPIDATGATAQQLPQTRPATPPMGVRAVAPAEPPVTLPTGALPPKPEASSAGFVIPLPDGVHASTRFAAPFTTPEEAMLDRLEAILRGYPEVEWACLGIANGTSAIGLRIDARIRNRVGDLATSVQQVGQLAVVVLDDMAHFKSAKSEAFVFFPWRRKQ